jgi:hypothetical protein
MKYLAPLLTVAVSIALSQPNYYDFLVNQPLGRLAMLVAIYVVSRKKVVFGLVLVTLVILFTFENDNQFGLLMMEPFTSGKALSQPSIAGPERVGTTATTHTKQQKQKQPQKEGFLDREDSLKRGKASNSIPMEPPSATGPVEPYDPKGYLAKYP